MQMKRQRRAEMDANARKSPQNGNIVRHAMCNAACSVTDFQILTHGCEGSAHAAINCEFWQVKNRNFSKTKPNFRRVNISALSNASNWSLCTHTYVHLSAPSCVCGNDDHTHAAATLWPSVARGLIVQHRACRY